MRMTQKIPQTDLLKAAEEATPLLVAWGVFLSDLETLAVIFSTLCAGTYYGAKAYLTWRDRNKDDDG